MKIFNNKKGIELSINMLVIIIISLVVLGLGVKLLFSLMEEAEREYDNLDQQTKDELNRLLDLGKKVALPYNSKTLSPGDMHSFGLGIRNIEDEKEFVVEITCSKFIPEDQNVVVEDCDVEIKNWFLFKAGPYKIKKNQHKEVKIAVIPPKGVIKGHYIFDVRVKDNANSLYGNKQKIDVTVR